MNENDNLFQIQKIINDFWPGEALDEEDDIIEFEYYSSFIHKLILDKDSGKISIGCQFVYDDNENEMSLSDSEDVYWLEKSFFQYLEKHSEYEVSKWHDLCYDLGYPGSDYDVYIGFECVECSRTIIGEYLRCFKMFEKRIKTAKDAIEYLVLTYFGEHYLNTEICIQYVRFDKNVRNSIDAIYEGDEYYFCGTEDKVYVCSIRIYRQVKRFFQEYGIDYEIVISDNHLFFISKRMYISIRVNVADESYLEFESLILQFRQKETAYALERLFVKHTMNLIQEKTESQIREDIALLKDIFKTCIKLIQNCTYKNQSENVRNDYIRDILEARGYFVKDQTRTGVSSSGESSGEADLVIQRKGIPVSFVEALNLNSVNVTYIYEHIDRLFKYDQSGVSSNFLICYVSVKDNITFIKNYVNCITPLYNFFHKKISYRTF